MENLKEVMQNKDTSNLDQFSTDELQKYIYDRRAKETKIKEQEFKNRVKSELELKFEDSLQKFNTEYANQLNIVKEQFNKLTDISEQYGIPFQFSIFELFGESSYRSASYNPKSYKELWSELDYQIFYENKVYGTNGDGWNTSSLSSSC